MRDVQWLGQAFRVAPSALGQGTYELKKGALYRGAYAITAPPIVGCAGVFSVVQPFLLGLDGVAFPADLAVYTSEQELQGLTPPWPSDKIYSAGPGECVVHFQGRAISSILLDDAQLRAIPGGRLLDFWEQPATGAPGIPQPPREPEPAPWEKCPPGEIWDAYVEGCVEPGSEPTATCPPGYRFDAYVLRDCVAEDELPEEPPAPCPAGQERDQVTGLCRPVAPPPPSGCPSGTMLDPKSGQCVPTSMPPPVGPCSSGMQRDAAGNCVAVQPPPVPVAGAPKKKKRGGIIAALAIGAAAVGIALAARGA